ncbi:MAG: (4Fe-4S)-binding protein [Deltaproteobacteria bacterium]|nr:(4Fe-4S)-binding protein [Deltaproteobacteria bacterium]
MRRLKTRRKGEARRNFLKTVLAGAVMGAALLAKGERSEAAPAEESLSALPGGESPLLRMQRELQRAMKKPIAERNWVMVIDQRKCVGCSACRVACVTENALPPGVTYRTVPEVENGSYPEVKRFFMPTQCMQCDKPPCLEASNAISPGSMTKRPDGIVAINYRKFRGRRAFQAAVKACPYKALYYDDGRFFTDGTPAFQPYEASGSFDYGELWKRVKGQGDPPIGGGRKCHFCLHRLSAEMLPVCVTTCIGRAAYFGDLNDPQSLVSELLEKNQAKVVRIRENRATEPRVYYIVDEPALAAAYHT